MGRTLLMIVSVFSQDVVVEKCVALSPWLSSSYSYHKSRAPFPFTFRHNCKFPEASPAMSPEQLLNCKSIKPVFFINYPVSGSFINI